MARRAALLERDGELDAGRELVADVLDGRRGVLLVEGPPGIGRSSLAEEFASGARRADTLILTARCSELRRQSAFSTARELFGHLEGIPDDLLDADEAAVRNVLEHSAASTGSGAVAIAVDDAQWADEYSLDLLAQLAAPGARLPLALYLTVGPGASEAGAKVLTRLRAQPHARTITPGPLSAGAVAELVEAHPDTYADSAAVARETAGNPLLVAEVLAAGSMDPGAVPESVERSVAGRLARHSGPARRLAGAVAVLGEAPLPLAAEVAGLDETVAPLAAEELTAGRLLAPGTMLRFAAPLVARAVARSLAPFARSRIHRRAAMLLHYGGAGPEPVAAHLVASRADADPWVVDALRSGARVALDRGDPAEAARFLERAMAEPPELGARYEILLDLAQAEAVAGTPTAVRRFAAALDHVAQPRRRAQAWHGLSRLLAARGESREAAAAAARGLSELPEGDAYGDLLLADELGAASSVRDLAGKAEAEVEGLARAARDGAPPGHPALVVPLVSYLSRRGEDLDKIARLARAAVARDPLVDPDARGFAVWQLAMALIDVDEIAAALAILEPALTRAREIGDATAVAGLRTAMATAWMHEGRLDDAENAAVEAFAALSSGWDTYARTAAFVRVRVCLTRGDVAGAERALETLEPVADHALASLGRGWLLYARGDAGRALIEFLAARLAEQGLRAANPAVVPWGPWAALAAHRSGDPERAEELAEEAVERAREVPVPRALGLALHVAGLVNGDGAGLDLLAESVEVLEGSPSRLELAGALVDLGAAVRRGGRRNDSREPLERALEMAEGFGAAAIAARAREELGAAGAQAARPGGAGLDALTASERRVAELAAEGMTSPDIAARLFVSRRTVETHLARTYRKLGINARRELKAVFSQEG